MEKTIRLSGEREGVITLSGTGGINYVKAKLYDVHSGIHRAYLTKGDEEVLIGVLEPGEDGMILEKVINPRLFDRMYGCSDGFIAKFSGGERSVISASNWERYKDPDGEKEHMDDMPKDDDKGGGNTQAREKVYGKAGLVSARAILDAADKGEEKSERTYEAKASGENMPKADSERDLENNNVKKIPADVEGSYYSSEFPNRFYAPEAKWSKPLDPAAALMLLPDIVCERELRDIDQVFIGETGNILYVAVVCDLIRNACPFFDKFKYSSYIQSKNRGNQGSFLLAYDKIIKKFVSI